MSDESGKATKGEHEMRGVRFVPEVNLGHILSASVFLVSAGLAWASMDARVTIAERDIKALQGKDLEQALDARNALGGAETRLLTRITEQRAHMDQTQVRVADDIREIKTLMRDGFRDLDSKLDRKVDKPNR